MKVIFLDRDGVINQYPGDRDYVKNWGEFRFLPCATASLKKLNDAGFRIFVISNQAGVGKGIYSKADLDLITANMLDSLKKEQVVISGVYYCLHRPEDNCLCRKPKTGLIDKAIARIKEERAEIDIAASYFIGDSLKDVETGRAAGLKTILVFSGKEKPENSKAWRITPDFTAASISAAADIILKR